MSNDNILKNFFKEHNYYGNIINNYNYKINKIFNYLYEKNIIFNIKIDNNIDYCLKYKKTYNIIIYINDGKTIEIPLMIGSMFDNNNSNKYKGCFIIEGKYKEDPFKSNGLFL